MLPERGVAQSSNRPRAGTQGRRDHRRLPRRKPGLLQRFVQRLRDLNLHRILGKTGAVVFYKDDDISVKPYSLNLKSNSFLAMPGDVLDRILRQGFVRKTEVRTLELQGAPQFRN